jgi:uncharacterized membrane-anchored protein
MTITLVLGVLIAVCAAMTIAMFFIKLKWYPIFPAAFWFVIGNNNLANATVKDWTNIDWTLGYLFYAFSVFCFACVLLLNKADKTITTEVKDTREKWEIEDEAFNKRMNYHRRRRLKRPQQPPQNPYDRY